MWIGIPGDLREMRNPARGAEISGRLGVTEHQGVSGALRYSGAARVPRRWAVEWRELDAVSADWVRVLARRVYGRGPVVVIDPSTRNYLLPKQSIGGGDRSNWSVTQGSLTYTTSGVQWERTADGALVWQHPVWHGWPVTGGMDVSWQHEAAHPAVLEWFDSSESSLGTVSDPSSVVTGTAPAGAWWVVPSLTATGSGTLPVPRGCLAYGQPLASPWPEGEHAGAVVITDHREGIVQLPRRSVRLEWSEVG